MNHELSKREELILIAVGLLQGNAYAYTVQTELLNKARVRISLASIHTILYRLENRGLLGSRLGGSSERRGGRSKRLYSLTGSGASTIRAVHTTRVRLWTELQPILSRLPDASI
jgi:DNA-binding PadR family transcriptional regulator